MMKLIFNTTLIIAIIILSDRMIGAYLDKKYVSNHCNYNEGALNSYLSLTPPDTLIIGSSRAIHMIVPDSLGQNTKILGQQQKRLYYHHSIMSILDQHKKLPKKVLILNIEVDDIYLEHEQRLLNQVTSLSYFYNKNNIVTSYLNKSGKYERLKYLSSIYRHNDKGLLLLTNPLQNICHSIGNKGYIPLHPTKFDQIRIVKGLKEDSVKYSYSIINAEFKNVIHDLKVICKKNHIKLFILNAPYYQFYNAMHLANKEVRMVLEKENIDYIDFMKYPENELKDQKLWYDHIHLNHVGAQIYSRLLKNRLKESAPKNGRIIN